MFLDKCPKCGTENSEKAEFCSRCAANLESAEVLPTHPPPLLLAEQAVFSPKTPEALVAIAEPEHSAPGQTPAEKGSLPPPEMPVAQKLIEPPKQEVAPSKTAPQAAAASPPMFGVRYKVIEMLGSGRLGTVYKVFDNAFKRELAVRAIKAEPAPDPELYEGAVESFKKQRRIIHKNVGWIIDLGAEKGTLYLTMGYTPGQELSRLMNEKGRLPVEKALDLATQLCSGLAEAHRQETAHLDLRPGNIVIDNEGRMRIMDLGIVSFLRAKKILKPDFIMGKPEYLSPEQIDGKEGDKRSDVYSLGLIFYQMVTGRPAFKGETAFEIRQKQAQESPRAPHLLNPLVSEPLSHLILKCLEKNPIKRYESALEVLSALDQVITGAGFEPAKNLAPDLSIKQPVTIKAKTDRLARKKGRAGRKFDLSKFIPRKQILVPASIVIAGALLGFILWRFVIHPNPKGKELPAGAMRLSVAVLPFEDSSPAKSNEYWGDGMTEILIDGLTKIDTLFVPALDSSFSFKGKRTDFKEIGLKLGVNHLLKVDFEKNDNSLIIDAKLLRAKDGSPVWSLHWDRNPAEVTKILEEIVLKVIDSIGGHPPQGQRAAIFQEGPGNPEAYDLYAQGRSLMRKGTAESLEKAIERFQKASENDPRCALIQTGIAEAYIGLGNSVFWPPDKAFLKAKTPVLDALAIAPGLARARALLAIIKWKCDWDFAGAEKSFQEALRDGPNSARVLRPYAEFLSILGRHEEAIEKITMARAQDPFSPRIHTEVGVILYYSRLYDQAIEEMTRALAIDPEDYVCYQYLGQIYIQLGQYDRAVQSFRRAKELGGDAVDLNLHIAYVNALQKRRRDAGNALAEALRMPGEAHVSFVSLAAVYTALFETNQALECLKKALSERDPRLLLLKVHPMFDFLQRDAPYIELLRKIGLEN